MRPHQFKAALSVFAALLLLPARMPAQSDNHDTDPSGVDLRPEATLAVDSDSEGAAGFTVPMEAVPESADRGFLASCASTIGCSSPLVPSVASAHLFVQSLHSGAIPDESNESSRPAAIIAPKPEAGDSGSPFFYRNKLEFSLDGGWLPINIPFVFDVFLGDGYTMTNLKYTLVPIIASIRWQTGDVKGPWIFRGNFDVECSGAVTLIPRGPETRYFAWILGFRRNFVPRRGRVAPYFDGRVGLGGINAKAPLGVLYAQGQDFTFTLNMGSGIRYNFSPRYSISAGLNWMHISNLYLSQPQFANYGVNVYGPMFGLIVRVGRLGHHASE